MLHLRQCERGHAVASDAPHSVHEMFFVQSACPLESLTANTIEVEHRHQVEEIGEQRLTQLSLVGSTERRERLRQMDVVAGDEFQADYALIVDFVRILSEADDAERVRTLSGCCVRSCVCGRASDV